MLEKNKNYSYEEIKKIFEDIEIEVVMNPFGEKETDKKIDGEAKFMIMMVAMPTIKTLKNKLFGEEEK